MAKATRVPNKVTIRSANNREPPVRVPFGLGAPAGGRRGECLRCGFGNMPVVEEVVWTIPLPLPRRGADDVRRHGQPPAPARRPCRRCSVDSTFLINGILQTDILTQGIGVHVFCEPMTFTTIGNAFAAPSDAGRDVRDVRT